jgi:hypothetical protein
LAGNGHRLFTVGRLFDPAAVKGGVEVGAEIADAAQEGRRRQGYRPAVQAGYPQGLGDPGRRIEPYSLLVPLPIDALPVVQQVAQLPKRRIWSSFCYFDI